MAIFYKISSLSFGNDAVKDSWGNSLIINQHGMGGAKSGYYAVAIRIKGSSDTSRLSSLYKPYVCISNSSYILMLWDNGDPSGKVFFSPA